MATLDPKTWRALVDKELAGAPFDKLVQKTPEGLAIEPLYFERPAHPPPPGAAPFIRGATLASAGPAFALCMRAATAQAAAEELDGGADAIWCDAADLEARAIAAARGATLVLENARSAASADGVAGASTSSTGSVWSSYDVLAEVARGSLPVAALDAPWPVVAAVRALDGAPASRCVRIGALAFHDLGADAADELALTLSSLVATLRQLDDAGLDLSRASRLLWVQLAIGRDTFGELCKLRALRLLWHKVLTAAAIPDDGLRSIHAVCSNRTLSQRDPWVNMLRVTTQVFAASLGGARLVTPLPFDAAFATHSPLGQRVARNTALVLREESQLGRVIDAGGGSFYLETRTDALAREAWARFTAFEREGGVVQLLQSGALGARLAASWKQRAAAIARRKEPVLGVSEFANLGETLPAAPAAMPGVRRDAEGFEAMRAKVETAPRDVALVLLGPPAEHRARAGFAEAFFAVAGVQTTTRGLASSESPEADAAIARDATRGGVNGEASPPQRGRESPLSIDVACLCGSDERYQAEAETAARALKASGARRVVLAGRPGALEAPLRAAGVDAFIYVGCDVLATLEEVLV
jgi:methylmalonyl-CoA mutase